uniref:Innexin n=1 Tax=Strongyloides papillosus TaxID=174720 RepID=A0A0N5BUM4_STREA
MFQIPLLDDIVKKLFSKTSYDDSINRLCSTFTTTLLIFFTLLVSAKQYIGKPIQCWVPQEFEKGWEEYAEDICFIKNTYYIPSNESIPIHHVKRNQAQIGYYQWVPIILSLMAFFFYLPKWIQKFLISQSGIDINTIITEANSLKCFKNEEKDKNKEKLKNYISECLGLGSRNTAFLLGCYRFDNNRLTYMTVIHIATKFLYLLNIILQFMFLNNFLGPRYKMWGFEDVGNLLSGREWQNSPIFPRVTLCDFQVRRLANLHRYTVQCVLMINMFNEKIFLFIWFWFFVVAVVIFINFIYTLWRFVIPMNRIKNVCFLFKNSLVKETTDGNKFNELMNKFINYIKCDGCLILSYIEDQVGGIVVRDIAEELFKDFQEKEEQKRKEV